MLDIIPQQMNKRRMLLYQTTNKSQIRKVDVRFSEKIRLDLHLLQAFSVGRKNQNVPLSLSLLLQIAVH